MLPFKKAIQEWETPLGETMIGYSALTRKACSDPNNIFVMAYWDETKKNMLTKAFDVKLEKHSGRWLLSRGLFQKALEEKINAIEKSNIMGKTEIVIQYPEWLTEKKK